METTYKLLKLTIWVLVFAVVIAGAWVLYNNLSASVQMTGIAAVAPEEAPEATERPKQAAPDFTVYDAEGQPYKLSDFQGKPVVLNFWASWCGPCRSEMPEFQSFFEKYGQDVHFVMVNLTDGAQETVESAGAYIAEGGYSFPVYFDTAMEAAYAYAVQAVPVTYFIDAEGNLTAYAQGALNADMLRQGMEKIGIF